MIETIVNVQICKCRYVAICIVKMMGYLQRWGKRRQEYIQNKDNKNYKDCKSVLFRLGRLVFTNYNLAFEFSQSPTTIL